MQMRQAKWTIILIKSRQKNIEINGSGTVGKTADDKELLLNVKYEYSIHINKACFPRWNEYCQACGAKTMEFKPR